MLKKLTELINFCLFICFCLILLVTYGCEKKSRFSNELSGTLTIVGSSSTQEVCDALAKQFTKINPKVEVIKSGAGSAQAAVSVLNSTAQIGDLSRNLNSDEHPEQFDCHTIALDGIAVCVNKQNPVKSLSLKQLQQIFTGKIKNWADLGGNNAAIVPIGRDEASGTKFSFENLIGALNSCNYLIEQDSNGKIKEKIKNNQNAVGYISFSSSDESIKPLEIDGVKPTFENILNKTYVLKHPFLQIVKKNSCDELVNAWFDFIYSTQGKAIIENCKLTATCRN